MGLSEKGRLVSGKDFVFILDIYNQEYKLSGKPIQ